MLLARPRRASWLSATLVTTGLALALAYVLPAPGSAQTQSLSPELAAQARAIKATQRRMLMAGPLRHLQSNRAFAKEVRRALKKHQPIPERGARLKRPPTDVETPTAITPLPRYSIEQALTVPTNVICNNTAGDGAGSGQCEESIASWGPYVLTAWNDGQGFISGPDTQGYGYSLNGGVSFIDGGMVPKTVPTGTWTSDPVVTVNEKTGEFWYCGLYDADASNSGLAVVKATFTPGGITWGTVRIPDMKNNSQFFIDKQWCVVDSSTGNLYVTYTKFTALDDSIMFSRSTDGGVSWSPPMAVSNPATAGLQQGSRPVVGPNGEVYVVWSEIGPIDADFFMMRKSTNFGVSFGSEVTANAHYANFGTGAPGFNRERSVDFPSVAVDRTNGPHRGRVYMTWHESINWYNDVLGGGGSKTEVESNSSTITATPFTPGQRVRGAFSSTADVDWFSFAGTQGTTYIFAVDSVPRPLYAVRIYCTDGVTRLSYAGEYYSQGGASYITFTAPATATYYLRMNFVSNPPYTSLIGGYRIMTGVNTPGPEVGRDQRDVAVSYSDNGTTWSTPTRVNDESAWYDDWLPEVGVGADGMPYVIWFDWRSTTCGGSSHIYASRSSDGGATWAASQQVSSVVTPWTTVATNIAPNEGDYNTIYGDDRYVRPAWADGRGGTPDVYTTAIDTWFTMSGCPADTSLHTLDVLALTASVSNGNPLFANDYTARITTARNWPAASPSPLTVGALSGNTTGVSVAVPDTAAPGVMPACLEVRNSTGTLVRSCCFNITVLANAGVGSQSFAFRLGQNVPNPVRGAGTRIDYTLPRAGTVRLEIFGLSGERVRTLVDGARAAGPNSAVWDGRDGRGRVVSAGTYFYRISGLGQTAVKRLVVLP